MSLKGPLRRTKNTRTSYDNVTIYRSSTLSNTNNVTIYRNFPSAVACTVHYSSKFHCPVSSPQVILVQLQTIH